MKMQLDRDWVVWVLGSLGSMGLPGYWVNFFEEG